ncbi:hypothetical protein DICVIV_10747 [Dictyocaulus viviparus]|uniref:Uncharacterized protein n=1 Tax=Dictyocaulus viviparus TaxID=29172 RepID=A0A0D8XLJ3_DICVI|nr:hypothetical protein DICVIV_10747 [Dictyocaulus viviparus]
MDGFLEANLLLSSALEQLDCLIIRGSSAGCFVGDDFLQTDETFSSSQNGEKNVNEGLNISSTNYDENHKMKESNWIGKDWREHTASDGSSEADSPPSDIPTSSSSLCNTPKIYSDFVKAIEDQSIIERPNHETQLKIMQWLAGRTERMEFVLI